MNLKSVNMKPSITSELKRVSFKRLHLADLGSYLCTKELKGNVQNFRKDLPYPLIQEFQQCTLTFKNDSFKIQ